MPGRSIRGRLSWGTLCRRVSAPAIPIPANSRLTYRHHRQLRYSVSAPPSSRPTAAPEPASAPNTPNALPRSAGSVNVVASSDSAAGARMAPKRALDGACGDQHAEALSGAAESGGDSKPGEAAEERPLAPEQIRQPAAEQEQRAEAQRVRRHHPLAVGVGEVQGRLRVGKRDVHDRRVEHDHQLGDAEHGEDEPAALVVGILVRVRVHGEGSGVSGGTFSAGP